MSDYSDDGFEDEEGTKTRSPIKDNKDTTEKYDSDTYEDEFEEDDDNNLPFLQKSNSPERSTTTSTSTSTSTSSTASTIKSQPQSESKSSPCLLKSSSNDTAPSGTQWTHIDPEDIEVGQRIGGGGFAIVYEGYWNKKHVALKTLFNPNVTDKLKQEFMDELHVMSSLSHPNCVDLYAANTRPPKLVIVMELCDRSLYQFLHQTKEPLSQELAMQMAIDTAAGLAYLHEQTPPIIHRDIKSMNLLLTVNKTVKLCDYGLVTTKVTAAGTPSYMAPELLQSKAFSKKVDVYAFSIILWELFKREVPWVGYAPMEVRNMVLDGERPDIPTMDCPFLARGMMRRCWAQDPKDRPEFADALRELKDWEPPVNHLAMLDSGVGDSLDMEFLRK